MEESQENGGFSFGSVADTEYVSYEIIDTQNKLPYHPFHFDLSLTILKSQPSCEQPGTQIALSRQKTQIFGRRNKVTADWTDLHSTPQYLNSRIISGKHFSINQDYVIKDLKSKNGTYIWVDRSHARKIQLGDTFLIANEPLVITKAIQLPKPNLEMTFQNQIIRILQQKKVFLIGSHPRCDLVIPSLYHFEVCINLASFTIFTHLDQEEAEIEHGLWYLLRPQKKEEVILEHGNLILAQPYIFRVSS